MCCVDDVDVDVDTEKKKSIYIIKLCIHALFVSRSIVYSLR